MSRNSLLRTVQDHAKSVGAHNGSYLANPIGAKAVVATSGSGTMKVRKTTDQSSSQVDLLVPDNDLHFPIVAGSTYQYSFNLRVILTNGSSVFDYFFDIPGATWNAYSVAVFQNNGMTDLLYQITGTLMNVESGEFGLQWMLGVAAGTLTVKAESYVTYIKM